MVQVKLALPPLVPFGGFPFVGIQLQFSTVFPLGVIRLRVLKPSPPQKPAGPMLHIKSSTLSVWAKALVPMKDAVAKQADTTKPFIITGFMILLSLVASPLIN
jgi:hypothetical protein